MVLGLDCKVHCGRGSGLPLNSGPISLRNWRMQIRWFYIFTAAIFSNCILITLGRKAGVIIPISQIRKSRLKYCGKCLSQPHTTLKLGLAFDARYFDPSLKCNWRGRINRYGLPHVNQLPHSCIIVTPLHMNLQVANFQRMCPYMPAVVLYSCFFQGTVLQDYKCFIFCVCFLCAICVKSTIRQLQYSTLQPIVLVGYLGQLYWIQVQIGLMNVLSE